jgi:hypothetical protein
MWHLRNTAYLIITSDIITGGKYRQHPTKGYGHKKALQQTKGLSINMAATNSPALL